PAISCLFGFSGVPEPHFRIVDSAVAGQHTFGVRMMNIEYGRAPIKGRSIIPPVASQLPRPRRTRNETTHERRHAGRVESTGTVVVHARDLVIHGRIVDLAVGGVRVHVDSTVAPPSVATRVRGDPRV